MNRSRNFYRTLTNLKIWFSANFSRGNYWRVRYDNEPRFTRLLKRSEAKSLAKLYGGKAWIDYGQTTALKYPLTRYFLFYGSENGEKTKYIVDDCEFKDEAIIAIEEKHPDFDWTAVEQFDGC